jgi:hypothetical protein
MHSGRVHEHNDVFNSLLLDLMPLERVEELIIPNIQVRNDIEVAFQKNIPRI